MSGQPGGAPTRLVVFSDDWGRHPSSCQHLVRRLLDRHPTLWVNTIGTRRPRLSRDDARRALVTLRHWARGSRARAEGGTPDLSVIAPPMWPGFRAGWQRWANARLIATSVSRALGPRCPGERRVALTTLPLTADLVGRLAVDRWVYYCVDDLTTWPGLDGRTLEVMERRLVQGADRLIAASATLRRRLADLGRDDAALLTHGVDLEHWSAESAARGALPRWWADLARPILLFWGLVDRRLDVDWCQALVRDAAQGGTLVLVGPHQDPDPRLRQERRIALPGPVPYDDLPALAASADLLVMPYRDQPVTRAMQPLKLTEYLASGKPVVVRDLPATRPWSDAADVVETAEAMVAAVRRRLHDGVPPLQRQARTRLAGETWARKAAELEALLFESPAEAARPGTTVGTRP